MSPADPFCLENHALNLNLEKWSPEICIFNQRARHKCGPMNACCVKLNVSIICYIHFSREKVTVHTLIFLFFFFQCFLQKLFPHMAVLSPCLCSGVSPHPGGSWRHSRCTGMGPRRPLAPWLTPSTALGTSFLITWASQTPIILFHGLASLNWIVRKRGNRRGRKWKVRSLYNSLGQLTLFFSSCRKRN